MPFEADHRLQLKYYLSLVESQILYSDFCYPQGEVPYTKFWHNLYESQETSIQRRRMDL